MDVLSASEEECAMVAQDSTSADDLDDTTVTFGQQCSDQDNFEKVHYARFLNKKSSTEQEILCRDLRRTGNEAPHAAEHPRENIISSEQSIFHRLCLFGMRKIQRQHSFA